MKITSTSGGKSSLTISHAEWERIGKRCGWHVEAQHLQNVKKLEKLDDRELTRAIRDAIIAEEDAVKQYETVSDSTDNTSVKAVLQEIANEEKVHVGELQKLLNNMLKDEEGFLEEGAKEVEEKQ